MIDYDNNKEDRKRLQAINPFVEWDLIGRKLTLRENKELQVFNGLVIPWRQMEYGDSVFLDKPKWFFKVLKGDRHPTIKILIRWMDPDPITNKSGIRLWCVSRKHHIMKPKRFVFQMSKFKIYNEKFQKTNPIKI